VHLGPDTRVQFEQVYAQSFHQVCRYLRAHGAPDCELEDLAQEVFLVVQRKLAQFDGRNLPGWLYRIAALTVRDHRRRAWFRRFFHRQRELPADQAAPRADPSEHLDRRQREERLLRILSRMSEKHRTAFVLYEIEGMSGEEIAALAEIPVATVWTRLHYARRQFTLLVEEQRKKEDA
jgi:RNA polymerase sigma-70 factor (ECF subfamily)